MWGALSGPLQLLWDSGQAPKVLKWVPSGPSLTVPPASPLGGLQLMKCLCSSSPSCWPLCCWNRVCDVMALDPLALQLKECAR